MPDPEKHWLLNRIFAILADMEKRIIKRLQEAVGPANLLTRPEERSCYSYDASGRNFMPDAVALPEATEQVAALLGLAHEYRFPVIPRGAGSGTTGGALPVHGGLVIGFHHGNHVLRINLQNPL
ncbi:MAG: FAD-binding oxidoreductase, partial [Candidatus Electrothrix sp. EH2]|nr:FAD-binding oxidoreductase [Candidatus Electrothrix sp. EH2]